jgi:hypothetical protein
VADDRYLRKVEKERDITLKGAFWAEFIDGILALRRKASHNCETYDDVKVYQGEIRAYDKVFTLPDKLLTIVSEKDKKRATNR